MDALGVSAKEAGKVLGVSEWTIYRLIESEQLAKIPHLGKRVVIAKVELERFAAQGVLGAAS